MNPPANAEDTGLVPGLRRSPGEGNGNTLQYRCLGNPMDRGAWQAAVHGVTKSRTSFFFFFRVGHLIFTQKTLFLYKINLGKVSDIKLNN